jgi:uncharacterized repeat protein (TIGR03843 family)
MESDIQSLLTILQEGDISVHGEFVWGSNYTFLAQVTYQDQQIDAVYKPTRGERPLWDFPTETLALREVAAYQVSEALRWGLVPLTVYRRFGPLGPGSLQQFMVHDADYHYFNFSKEDVQRLRPVVLFDILINNADRKAGHILVGEARHLWLIDHGICFHAEEKLRTVVWDFVGEPIPEELCADIGAFSRALKGDKHGPSPLAQELSHYLTTDELTALQQRAHVLSQINIFPPPSPTHRPYPWPQI